MSKSILSHTFSNGLVLLAERLPSLESAAFTFLVPAGCVHDPPDRWGRRGFRGVVVLGGGGPRDSRDFVLDLDNLGVERHESVYAAHASFSGAMLAENLPASLGIYADMLRRAHLPPDQLEAGRLVMFQELRAVEDEPAQKIMIELRRRHYGDPWGRPAQGEQQALEAITLDDIRPYFQQRYGPNGTILGVAGRFDWQQLKDTVEALLGDWQRCATAPIVEQASDRRYRHLSYDSGQTQIGVAYPSVPYRDPDYFQAWGAVGVLSGGSSARLFTEVRERRGLCYSVHASYGTLRDRGGVFCYAGTTAERAQQTLDVILAELARLAEGIRENELQRLKARIKSSLIMQQESSSARSSAIARDWYHLGRARTLDELGQLVDGLTADSINAYLADHPPRDFAVVTLGCRELDVPVEDT